MAYTGRVKIADIAPGHPFARPCIIIGNRKEYDYGTDLQRSEAGTEAATGGVAPERRGLADLPIEGKKS
jgi:hypothetical protein